MQTVLMVPPVLTIYEVQQMALEWLPVVAAAPARLELNLSQLQELDGAGFQLILSLLKALPATKFSVEPSVCPHSHAQWLWHRLQVQGLLAEEPVC
jgi:anti-anti-sigma regulatory factor